MASLEAQTPDPPASGFLRTFRARLFEPVDAASLGLFRIMFAALMLWELARYFHHGWIHDYFIAPPFHFKFLYFEWVRRWPGDGMYLHFAAMGLLALLVALGLFYRLAILLFFLAFSYVFLLDQSRYLNHFYLVCLVAFLLSVVGANRWGALDHRLFHRDRPALVPFWNLFLLRAQMFVVYFYAGVAKMNADWLLRAEPIGSWLERHAGWPLVGPLMTREWVAYLVAYGGLLFDLSIGFLLCWRATRPYALLLAFGFHTTNLCLFNIGIFPYLAMALTLLFLEPDWPRALLRRLLAGWSGAAGNRDGVVPEHAGAQTGRIAARTGVDAAAPEASGPGLASPPARKRASVLAFLAAYLGWQVLMPLRHWLYPGDVNWTEEGHRFAWRMKLRDKEGRISIVVVDPRTGREYRPDPHRYLLPWQFEEMVGRPDMVVQFAHYLRDRYRQRRQIPNPEVFVSILCSLNGAPEAELIDPGVDLSRRKRSLWPADWILPRGTVIVSPSPPESQSGTSPQPEG